MLSKLTLLLLTLLFTSVHTNNFKQEQLRRVRKAYQDKVDRILSLLESKKIRMNELNVYLRAFKEEER